MDKVTLKQEVISYVKAAKPHITRAVVGVGVLSILSSFTFSLGYAVAVLLGYVIGWGAIAAFNKLPKET